MFSAVCRVENVNTKKTMKKTYYYLKCSKTNEYSVYCILYNSTFSIRNKHKYNIEQHILFKKDKENRAISYKEKLSAYSKRKELISNE